MKGYTIGRALLLAVTALLLAAATASTASARMAPPETALLQPSTSVTPGVKLAIDVPAKNKHHHVIRRRAQIWAGIPSGCTLGFVDGYAWGYSC